MSVTFDPGPARERSDRYIGNEYDGWAGISTASGWVGYAVACVFLPMFFLSFIGYMTYRLVSRKRGHTASGPWISWGITWAVMLVLVFIVQVVLGG